jgi:hypothetical protein
MIYLGNSELRFKQALLATFSDMRQEHRNFLIYSYATSRYISIEQVLQSLSDIETQYPQITKKDMRLLKLMFLYHSVRHDNKLSRAENIHRNAQLSYDVLLDYQTLSDTDCQTVYGGIVSTIVKSAYYKKTKMPEAVQLFVHFYESNKFFLEDAFKNKSHTSSPKNHLTESIHAMFSEKAYLA